MMLKPFLKRCFFLESRTQKEELDNEENAHKKQVAVAAVAKTNRVEGPANVAVEALVPATVKKSANDPEMLLSLI